VAAAGVVIQMASGVAYPAIPPVLFILLVPAGLIAFAPWRWTPVLATLGGLFLIVGLVSSGAAVRLLDLSQRGGVGGSVGLWVQMLAVVAATVAGVGATLLRYRSRTPVLAAGPR
jgi:hypothetical protein